MNRQSLPFRGIIAGFLVLVGTGIFASARANENLAFGKVKNYQFAPDAYKDLPGVKDPRDLAKQKEQYACQSVLVSTRNPPGVYRDVFGVRGLPVQGYKCTDDNGLTLFSTTHPKARNNHPHLDPYTNE